MTDKKTTVAEGYVSVVKPGKPDQTRGYVAPKKPATPNKPQSDKK